MPADCLLAVQCARHMHTFRAAAWLLVVPVLLAQAPPAAKTTMSGTAPQVNKATSLDWPLHNHDLGSGRYVAASEITAANASKIALKWSFKPDVVAGAFGLPDEAAKSSVLTSRNSF